MLSVVVYWSLVHTKIVLKLGRAAAVATGGLGRPETGRRGTSRRRNGGRASDPSEPAEPTKPRWGLRRLVCLLFSLALSLKSLVVVFLNYTCCLSLGPSQPHRRRL